MPLSATDTVGSETGSNNQHTGCYSRMFLVLARLIPSTFAQVRCDWYLYLTASNRIKLKTVSISCESWTILVRTCTPPPCTDHCLVYSYLATQQYRVSLLNTQMSKTKNCQISEVSNTTTDKQHFCILASRCRSGLGLGRRRRPRRALGAAQHTPRAGPAATRSHFFHMTTDTYIDCM